MSISIDIIFKLLKKRFGNLRWWPIDTEYHKKNSSDSRFEVIVGAILTQNTSWSNVEKALENLKSQNVLELKKITSIKKEKLREFIKPSGFFNQKAERLKTIAEFLLHHYNANLDTFFHREVSEIRRELLSLNGIGPETADSILLYAGNSPIFIVDTYTKRLCQRFPLNTDLSYESIQQYFEQQLSKKYSGKKLIQVYNEFHALIVNLGKRYCKKKPLCATCPLTSHCTYSLLSSS